MLSDRSYYREEVGKWKAYSSFACRRLAGGGAGGGQQRKPRVLSCEEKEDIASLFSAAPASDTPASLLISWPLRNLPGCAPGPGDGRAPGGPEAHSWPPEGLLPSCPATAP